MQTLSINKKGHLWQLHKIARKKGLHTHLFKLDQKYTSLLVSNKKTYKIFDGHKLGYYPSTNKHFVELCNSKIESEKVLKSYGYNILNSIDIRPNTFTNFESYCKYIFKHLPADFPLLIKPEVGLRGIGIHTVNTETQLLHSVKKLYSSNKNFLIQQTTYLPEFRILFTLGKAIFVHSKGFPVIKGDGKQSALAHFSTIDSAKRDRNFFTHQLHQIGLNTNSILPEGVSVPYHITRKGTFDTVYADNIPSQLSRWAKKLGKDLNTDTIGIDVFIDGEFNKTTSYRIIEINANPAFMYIKHKYKRADVVERHCTRILDASFPD